jgi:hypothetical protein
MHFESGLADVTVDGVKTVGQDGSNFIPMVVTSLPTSTVIEGGTGSRQPMPQRAGIGAIGFIPDDSGLNVALISANAAGIMMLSTSGR